MVRDHIDSINALLALLQASTATEIEISEGPVRIRVSKAFGARPVHAPAAPATQPEVKERPVTGTTISAPMFGVFHQAPSPGAGAFVAVGDRVQRGQQLCVLEAMKVFSPVTAPVDGTIRAVLVSDGQEVVAGQALFSMDDGAS